MLTNLTINHRQKWTSGRHPLFNIENLLIVYTYRLAPALSKLSSEFSDCVVVVGSTKFDCHKVILACASEFFNGMLTNEFKESISGEIHLQNVTPKIFEKFRKYVYTYNTCILKGYDTSTILDLYECANQWLVASLTDECLNVLLGRAESMDVEGLIELYEYSVNFDIKILTKKIQFILWEKHSEKLLCDRVLLLGSDVFMLYMTNVTKKLPEIQRFKMIEKYLDINGFLKTIICKEGPHSADDNNVATDDITLNHTEAALKTTAKKKEYTNDGDYVKSLLKVIDYTKMTTNEFYDGPGKCELLTHTFKFEMLYKICTKQNLEPTTTTVEGGRNWREFGNSKFLGFTPSHPH